MVKRERNTAATINAYLEEYRQALASDEIQQAKSVTAEGIQDILEEFHEKVSLRLAQKGEAETDFLLDQLTEEEREAFDPQQPLEHKADVVEVEEVVEDQTVRFYKKATDLVLESIRQADQGLLPDMDGISKLAEQMVDLVSADSSLLLVATDRRQEFAVSSHCVNVAILGLRLAQKLQYSREDQIRVGVAAFLHEIGVVKVAKNLMHHSGKVSSEVRQRPAYSAEILSELGPDYKWLVETVSQVYERENGSGLPLGLTGKDIREEAKILGIVDVLEACIHQRPYRGALTGYQLFCELTTVSRKSFSNQIVKALLQSFSLYPYNEYVILNTGEIAKVVGVNPTNLLRPRVKLLFDADGKRLGGNQEVDLQENSSRNIAKAIPYDTLPEAE